MPVYSTEEQLNQFYEEVMKAESIGLGAVLDRAMINKKIAPIFRKRFGISFHSSMVLLFAGRLPGHDKMLAGKISDYINEIEGVNVSDLYFGVTVATAVRSKYNLTHWPRFKVSGRRPLKKSHGSKSKAPYRATIKYNETCWACGKLFEEREDGFHCFCLSCCPRGVSYSPAISESKNIGGLGI